MARVLVLGADGMVGHVARIFLSGQGHAVSSIARSASRDWDSLDVEDEASLFDYVAERSPEYVINCIGVLVRESGENPERAIRLNALLPHRLSRMGGELGFCLVQVSSDCVFSGSSGPYSEEDRRDADDIYGRTKALGEIVNSRDLTIRTSKIGPELKHDGSGLFHWFIGRRGLVKGYGRAMWSGVTTLEMAKAMDTAMRDGIVGLVHLTNGVPISKFELLRLIGEVWGKSDVEIERDDFLVIDRSLRNTRSDFAYPVPGYREMLEEMRRFMAEHVGLYRHYSAAGAEIRGEGRA
jgi:dTDP-4-dehydrorhamnose reductase